MGRVAEQNQTRRNFCRGVMQSHRHPLRDRLRLARQQPQTCVDTVRWGVQIGIKYHIAASDGVFGDPIAGEVEGTALASLAAIGRTILRVD